MMKFRRNLRNIVSKSVQLPDGRAGFTGDENGLVSVPGRNNYIYVSLYDGSVVEVYNSVCPAVAGIYVEVGVDEQNGTRFRVLKIKNILPETGELLPLLMHSKTHQYPGYDTVYAELRQIMPLRVAPAGGLTISIQPGRLMGLTSWIDYAGEHSIDLSSHVPTADGLFVLLGIDRSDGSLSIVDGSTAAPENLTISVDCPFPAAGIYPLAAIRLFASQEEILETATTTDVFDLRQIVGGVLSEVNYVIKSLKFTAPTVDDDIDAGYEKGDEWLDESAGIVYFCADNASGAAVWVAVSASGGGAADARFGASGALAVATNVGDAIIVTQDMTVSEWYIYLKATGSSGSTIVDINLNGVTIFTDQANRPEVAWNDANGWAVSGLPDFVDFVAGDVITFDIDQIAPGASDLAGAGNISGSGGSSSSLIAEDGSGTPSVAHVGKIVFPSGTLVDDGGGQVTFNLPAWLVNHPDNPPASPDAMDDEFDGVSLDGSWSTFGSGTPTYTVGDGYLNIENAAATERLKGVEKSVSGSAWRFRTHVKMESVVSDYNGMGFSLKNSATGRYVFLGYLFHSSHGFLSPYRLNLSDADTAVVDGTANAWSLSLGMYLELEYTGVNFILRQSTSGVVFSEIIRVAKSDYITVNPTHIGLCIHAYGLSTSASFDWFRRMA